MEAIGLQQWNNAEYSRDFAAEVGLAPQHQRFDRSRDYKRQPHRQEGERERRRNRGGRDRPHRQQREQTIINQSTVMPPARPTREIIHTLTQLQKLYTLQQQLATARTQPTQSHQIPQLRRDVDDALGRLLQEAVQVDQQELVNLHGLNPVSPERLRALHAQILRLNQLL